MDFNAAACRQARRNGLDAVRGDAFNLPLADGTADLVLNVEFAQQYELEAVERMLHEVARVLRPYGRLVIVWGNRAALVHRLVHWLSSVVWRILNRLHDWTSIGHDPLTMQAAGERAGLALDRRLAVFPPLGLRFRCVDGPLANLVGSSFVAVFRKRAGP